VHIESRPATLREIFIALAKRPAITAAVEVAA
jgi:hypothetical protein